MAQTKTKQMSHSKSYVKVRRPRSSVLTVLASNVWGIIIPLKSDHQVADWMVIIYCRVCSQRDCAFIGLETLAVCYTLSATPGWVLLLWPRPKQDMTHVLCKVLLNSTASTKWLGFGQIKLNSFNQNQITLPKSKCPLSSRAFFKNRLDARDKRIFRDF